MENGLREVKENKQFGLLLWGKTRKLELNGKLFNSIRRLRLESWDSRSYQVDSVTLVTWNWNRVREKA